MKSMACVLILMLLMGTAASADKPQNTGPYVGQISPAQLLADYPDFSRPYAEYQPKQEDIDAFQSLAGKSIVVLFGTWCHDSKREIPKLLKLLTISQVPLADFSMHAVDYNKHEPEGLYQRFALRYSPTIILLRGDQELGRVVEKPLQSLAADLASFISH
jgi:hypothetical protein